MNLSMKLVCQYMAIFFTFSPTSNHLPLQVKNCDSNLRLVVDKDDNSEFRLERVNQIINFHRYSILINNNIFRHLKLEFASAIPASNEFTS